VNIHKNPSHDDLLERATEALRQTPISAGPPDDLVTNVVAHLEREEATDMVQPQSLFERIHAMKPITRFVVVASLFLVFCGLFGLLSPRSRALAFEEVAVALESIRSATCDMTSETSDVKNQSKAMFLAPSLERIETKMGDVMMSINICDLRAKKWLTLIPGQKMAIVLKMENAPEDRPANGSFELIRERVRKAQADPDKGSRPLGEKQIDGVRAVGFRLDDKTGYTDVWVDPKTSLPIRVETTFLGETKVEVVMTNFQYDVELDESLFSFDPPSDYTVHEMGLSLSPPSIKDLADMLRFGAENNGGVFPEEISGAKGVHLVMGKLLTEVATKHGQDSPQWKTALLEYSSRIARGSSFMMFEQPKSEWHYQGGGVKLDDAKTAIFWYKPQDSDTYQVLYGDLRVEKGVAETDLPKSRVKE
jgi:outer membrane lipoprotein-sorting protein